MKYSNKYLETKNYWATKLPTQQKQQRFYIKDNYKWEANKALGIILIQKSIFMHIYNFWGNVLSLENFLKKFLEKLTLAKSSFKHGSYIRSYRNY